MTFLFVPYAWRFRFGRCCEYHRFQVHIGPLIWRWDSAVDQ